MSEEQASTTTNPEVVPTNRPKFAFVNGQKIPVKLTPAQINVCLPTGILGLTNAASGDPVFPNEDGSLLLEEGVEYTSPPTPAQAGYSAQVQQEVFGGEAPLWGNPAAGGATTTAGSTAPFPHPQGLRPVLNAAYSGGAIPPRSPTDAHPNSFASPGSRFRGWTQTKTSQLSPNSNYSDSRSRGKLLLDRVHDHVTLCPVVSAIMDTPEFQRLRGLKQTGTLTYIYMGACHTRFEHSVGVSFLAGMLIKKLARRQPELEVSDRDAECVMVAGLCHDLGHGPFSHLFETMLTQIREANGDSRNYHHEEMSIKLLRKAIERIDTQRFEWTEKDTAFVELMIDGLPPGKPWPEDRVGRPASKRFMVEIVANKRSGIDVDKLDYFMRDSMCVYGRATVDCGINRIIAACKAMKGSDGEMQICFEEKMAMSLGDIFGVRAKLHKYCYQHRVTRVIDLMFSDALKAAEPFFKVRGSDGKELRITEAVEDIDAFMRLGDWIFEAINGSADPNLKPAQAILHRINSRQLYSYIGSATLRDYTKRIDPLEFKEELLQDFSEAARASMQDSICLETVKINYGHVDASGMPDDPVKSVSFFNPRSHAQQGYRLINAKQSPLFRPSQFREKTILVFSREPQHTAPLVGAFEVWKSRFSHHLLETAPTHNVPETPARSKRMREDL